jgi:hypothetical protein
MSWPFYLEVLLLIKSFSCGNMLLDMIAGYENRSCVRIWTMETTLIVECKTMTIIFRSKCENIDLIVTFISVNRTPWKQEFIACNKVQKSPFILVSHKSYFMFYSYILLVHLWYKIETKNISFSPLVMRSINTLKWYKAMLISRKEWL